LLQVWDVRKFIAEQDAADEEAEAEEAAAQQQDPRAPPPPREDGKSEVRRRGARRGEEYERNYEYGFEPNEQGGGDFDEYYSKEAKAKAVQKRGRSWPLIFGVMLLLAVLTLLLTATGAPPPASSPTALHRPLHPHARTPAAAHAPTSSPHSAARATRPI